jgi:hypothetical protein
MDNSDSNNPPLTTQEKVKRKRNRISKFPKQVNLDIDAARLVLLDQTAEALKKSRNALIRDFVDAGLGKYYKLAFMRWCANLKVGLSNS